MAPLNIMIKTQVSVESFASSHRDPSPPRFDLFAFLVLFVFVFVFVFVITFIFAFVFVHVTASACGGPLEMLGGVFTWEAEHLYFYLYQ